MTKKDIAHPIADQSVVPHVLAARAVHSLWQRERWRVTRSMWPKRIGGMAIPTEV